MIIEVNGENESITFYDSNRQFICTLFGSYDLITSYAMLKDKRLFASSTDTTIKLWDMDTGYVIKSFNIYYKILCMCFNPDGNLYVGSEHGILYDINCLSGLIDEFEVHYYYVSAIQFTPDNLYFLTCSGKEIKIWDYKSKNCLRIIEDNQNIYSFYFSNDSKLFASSGWDYHVNIWELETGNKICTINDENIFLYCLFSESGRYITTKNYNNNINIWNMRGKKVYRYKTLKKNLIFNWDYSIIDKNKELIYEIFYKTFPIDIIELIYESYCKKEVFMVNNKIKFIGS